MPLHPPASKLPSSGVSIFAVMSQLAVERGAINLSQGFPDFPCDPVLVETVAEAMRAGHNQYAPMPGLPALRERIASKIDSYYGHRYDPAAELTITAGATEALYVAITAFVQPGDEVLLFEPCYDSYVPAVQLSGGVPVFVTLSPPDYHIDWAAVRRAFSRRTRLLIVNTPHNPSGAVWSAEDVRELRALVDGSDALVIADEVYEHIIFDGRRHESLARYPDLAARAVVISSFGKSYHTTGWKVGYAAAPAPLTREIQRVHQFVTFAVNTPVQHAYASYMQARPRFDAVTALYQEKRDRFLSLIAGSRFQPLPCHGTYFQLLDYSDITSERDEAFAVRLIEEHGVASIPTSPFLHASEAPPVLRFCFAKKDETLERAAERLRRV